MMLRARIHLALVALIAGSVCGPALGEDGVTVVFEGTVHEIADCVDTEKDLWLRPDVHELVRGYELKPEGLCRGDVCWRLGPRRRDKFVIEGDDGIQVNLAALSRLEGRTFVHDAAERIWWFGPPAPFVPPPGLRPNALDFTLPDQNGNPVSLSDFRGSKVLLITWASW